MNKYNYEYKTELASKIEKTKKKEYLAKIFRIINPTPNMYSKTPFGILLYIHNLPDETYELLEQYLDYINTP